ncbi:MAG: hypothetical protein WA741_17420 [Candidatus Sulfotelmatobacter sp.]
MPAAISLPADAGIDTQVLYFKEIYVITSFRDLYVIPTGAWPSLQEGQAEWRDLLFLRQFSHLVPHLT